MTLGPTVDVAIGLIFVYLLLGLIVSAFQEVLANALKLRGRLLRNAIAGLLTDEGHNAALFEKIYGHALVRGASATKRPSYVPSRNFTLALIDTLTDGSSAPAFAEVERRIGTLSDGYVKQSLRIFVQHAGGDLDILKSDLARWYDDAMDRLSGVYKRFSQWIALALGVLLAVSLNIDSIRIAETLWSDEALRGQIAAAASTVEKPGSGPAKSAEVQLSSNVNQLLALGLPVGWVEEGKGEAPKSEATKSPFAQAVSIVRSYFSARGWGGGILVVVGWLITALATSLGAPFWFDTLQRFLSLRNSGPKPARADTAPATN